MDADALSRRLAAAEKTIAVLMRRVEERVASGETAFSVLEQNVALERVVTEKTRVIAAQREELQQALTHLGEAQSELLQTQRLESVARLASGIAHELNTPIQYVNDNVHFLAEVTADLLELLDGYRALGARVEAGTARPEDVAALRDSEHELELEFLREQGPKSAEHAIEGLQRIAALVRSLKEFAHPDEHQAVPSDLNACLTATLAISQAEYADVADVETELGELPPVRCHVASLNQVFLALIVNAAHAIAQRNAASGQRGLIRVVTSVERDRVCVAISDTGTGIPEEIREKIFDPFFTTKPVGTGTGQGLAIARTVVERHAGEISFATEEGKGTTFYVRLPIDGTVARRAAVDAGQIGP